MSLSTAFLRCLNQLEQILTHQYQNLSSSCFKLAKANFSAISNVKTPAAFFTLDFVA